MVYYYYEILVIRTSPKRFGIVRIVIFENYFHNYFNLYNISKYTSSRDRGINI